MPEPEELSEEMVVRLTRALDIFSARLDNSRSLFIETQRDLVAAAGALYPWVVALQAEVAKLRAENERWAARHNRVANALAAAVGDENGECVACGGSAVGDPGEHFQGCWVADETSGVAYDRWVAAGPAQANAEPHAGHPAALSPQEEGSDESPSPCMDCGNRIDEWAASDEAWTAVMGAWDAGHICPTCFIGRAGRMDVRIIVDRWFCETCDAPEEEGK